MTDRAQPAPAPDVAAALAARWEETARQYAANADYWRERYEGRFGVRRDEVAAIAAAREVVTFVDTAVSEDDDTLVVYDVLPVALSARIDVLRQALAALPAHPPAPDVAAALAAARQAIEARLERRGLTGTPAADWSEWERGFATGIGEAVAQFAALPAHPPAPPSEVTLTPVYPGDPGHGEPVWIEAAPPAPLPLHVLTAERLVEAFMQEWVWQRYMRGGHAIDASYNATKLADAVMAFLNGEPMSVEELVRRDRPARRLRRGRSLVRKQAERYAARLATPEPTEDGG